jgi:putative hydrolase of the HAD superfamily
LSPSSGPAITALFCDLGGVFLTNAWEHASRSKAAQAFGLDQEFERLHQEHMYEFETGGISLDEYLDRTVFTKSRAFSKADFIEFMKNESHALEPSLQLLASLAERKQYVITTLNNESRELNEYRVKRFGLRKYFCAFFCSCYLGVRKPDELIYRRAMGIAQRSPGESVFIDDREENIIGAQRVGMQAILFRDAGQLRDDLHQLGVG